MTTISRIKNQKYGHLVIWIIHRPFALRSRRINQILIQNRLKLESEKCKHISVFPVEYYVISLVNFHRIKFEVTTRDRGRGQKASKK